MRLLFLNLTAAALLTVTATVAGIPEANGAAKRPESKFGRTPLYDYDPPEPGSYRLPPLNPAADCQVIDGDGKTHRLQDLFSGRITILSFIYTRCRDPQACPYATSVLFQIHQLSMEDPVLAENLRLISFSFDPEHDTPEVMANLCHQFDSGDGGAPWTFLTTRSKKGLTPILQAYGQVVDRKVDPNDMFGPLNHTLRVYLIDRQGMIRNIYSYGLFDVRLVMSDVRTLLKKDSRWTPILSSGSVNGSN